MNTHSVNIALGALLALASSFLMSTTAALIRYASTLTSIEMIVLVQYCISLAVLLPWVLQEGSKGLKTDRFGLHLVRGLSGWVCFYAYYLALKHIPLVDATLLRNAAPLCVPLWLLFWLKVKLGWLKWLPLLVGFTGIGLILQPAGGALSFWHLVGFISAIALAGSIVTTRVLTGSEPTNRILFYYFLISALATLPLVLINLPPVPVEAWPPMVVIGLSVWLIMRLYTQAYRYAKASTLSPISYSGVVFAGFWGWLFWGQVPDIVTLAGVVLVVAGGIGSVVLGSKKA
ncbi:MAG: DMT family transporter [Marinobacterium sp.]|nr:DMT family transporter [Marinobacterium sp.]